MSDIQFPWITINSDGSEGSQKLVDCFNLEVSKLDLEVLTMEGMSGKSFRTFINNLVDLTLDARYLEIGSWYGSTVCSAINGNRVKATCIDNWSEHNGREKFLENTNKFKNDNVELTLIESNYRDVDFTNIGKFNIYMFDGPHHEEDQYNGVAFVQPALEDRYILIVDDWNHERVRNGTLNALKEINAKVLCEITVRTSDNDLQPSPACQDSDWHNGYYIALIEK